MVQLYDVISNGYKNKNKIEGFDRDDSLSNENNQLYVDHKNKKIIYNTTGTHNLKDWNTNFYLATGRLKETKRYKDAHKGIRDAKAKYVGYSTIATGDSLGGAITRGIASQGDKILTLNGASTIGERSKPKKDEINYRVKLDSVSTFRSKAPNTKTLENKNFKTGIASVDSYFAHIPSAIKKHNIKIN